MPAYMRRRFKRDFILSERSLRRIGAILAERAQGADGRPEPRYQVHRDGEPAHTTSNIEDVLAEASAGWQQVTRLTVSAGQEDEFLLELDFNRRRATNLKIEGSNRSFVFLVFSDLRRYLIHDADTAIRVPRDLLANYTAVVSIALFMTFLSINILTKPQSLHHNLFWVVGIGLAAGIGAGVAVWLKTER
jgi:hypothetical protein